MNSITELLDLEDTDIKICVIQIQDQTKTIFLESTPVAHFCPVCGYRMHSRGIKNRKINHPILQDNFKLVLILKQRRWRVKTRIACTTSAIPSDSSIRTDEQLMQPIC